MMVWIIFHNKGLYIVPVFHRPIHNKIILICHRPPDLRNGCKTTEQVIQIDEIFLHGHMREAPFIIWMKKDQVRLDPHVCQRKDLFFQMLPESKTRTVDIPLAIGILFKCI